MNPVVEALGREFKVCKVHIDTNQPLAARFGVSAVPTFLVFRGGAVVRRYEGVTPEPALRAGLAAPGRA